MSIYSHLPKITVPSLGAVRYDWEQASKTKEGMEIRLAGVIGGYRNENRDDRIKINCCWYDGGTGRYENEGWSYATVSCLDGLQTAAQQLPEKLGTRFIEPLTRFADNFLYAYNQRVEAAVEKALGKQRGDAFKKNYFGYQIGSISLHSQSSTQELRDLDTQGALFMGTEKPMAPKYVFHFEGKEPLKIHEPFLVQLAKREGVEGSCGLGLTEENFSTEGIDYDAFKALVTYIYTGKIECDAKALPKLEELAKRFGLPELEKWVGSLSECKGQRLLDLIQGDQGTEKKVSSLKQRLIAPFANKEEDPALSFRTRIETLMPELEQVANIVDQKMEGKSLLAQKLTTEVDDCVKTCLKAIGENFAQCTAASYTLAGWKGVYRLPEEKSWDDREITLRTSQQSSQVDQQGKALLTSTLFPRDMTWEIDGIKVEVHSEFCKDALLEREGENYITKNLFTNMGSSLRKSYKVNTTLQGAIGEELSKLEKGLARELLPEEVVKGLVSYLYTGEVKVRVKHLPGLCFLADFLSFPKLRKEVLDAMRQYPESAKFALEKGIAYESQLAGSSSCFDQSLEPMLRIETNIVRPLLNQMSAV